LNRPNRGCTTHRPGVPTTPTHPTPPDGEELVTIAEAAARLRMSVRTIQGWIRAGRLPVYAMSPKRRYVVWSAVVAHARMIADDFVASHGPGTATEPGTMRGAGPDDPPGERKDDG